MRIGLEGFTVINILDDIVSSVVMMDRKSRHSFLEDMDDLIEDIAHTDAKRILKEIRRSLGSL